MKKKLLTFLLAFSVCAGTVICPIDGNVGVRAEEMEEVMETKASDGEDRGNAQPSDLTYGDWKYRILEDGNALISDYIGKDEEVTIPSKIGGADGDKAVTQLENPFWGNEAVKIVHFEEGIESVGALAFNGCVNLEKIYLPESLTKIGKWAFDDCSSLPEITLPKNVCNIEFEDGGDSTSDGFFCGCSQLKNINVDSENAYFASVNGILCDKSGSTMLAYPEGKDVFSIPKSVTTLSDRAQHQIQGFKVFQVEEGNTSFVIVDNILYGNNKSELISCLPGAENMGSITLMAGTKKIDDYAFTNCESLTNVVLPEGVQEIGKGAFYGCVNLESVSLPGSLSHIPMSAFENCKNLKGIDLPEKLESIGEGAFEGCDSLKRIYIPKNVESLHVALGIAYGKTAFCGVKSLESIDVSEDNLYYSSEDGVLYDKNKTKLYQCPAQKETVKIPDSVGEIQCAAFSGCNKLQKIDLPVSLKLISISAFSDCTGLQGMIFPDGLKTIDVTAFKGCTGMKFVAIPPSVTLIDYGAFYTRNFEKILDVTIKCMKDSYAESYAKEHGFKYEIVDSFDGLVVGGEDGSGGGETKNPPTVVEGPEQEKNLMLDKASLMFDAIGSSQTLTAAVTPADKASQVTWSTSNGKVATVKDGIVTATGNGTAVITAALEDKSATATVTVSQKCKKISMMLNGQTVSGTLKAKMKKTYNFKAVVSPANADKKNAKVTWSTSDKKIATVKNGKVSVKKSGTVTITARTADGKTAKIKLKAGKQKIKVTKVKLAGSKTMKVKGKQTLNLTVMPATADNGKVSWSSSNKKIATVDSKGRVTAKKKGTVTITAKAKDGSGKKGSIKIKVK